MCIDCYQKMTPETALNLLKNASKNKNFIEWNTTTLYHILIITHDNSKNKEIFNMGTELLEDFYNWYLTMKPNYIPKNGIECFPDKISLRQTINDLYNL
jgi:hypothetical protein